jgi:hypothetical protein
MASVIYNSCVDDMARGNIDFDTDAFKVMLVTSAYVPDKDAHLKRSDVTNEVTGTGYTAGGLAATVTVAKDLVNDRVDVSLGGVNWPTSTITARGGVYYKSRGGAATADELVAYVDFGSNIISSGGAFNLSASTLRISNP